MSDMERVCPEPDLLAGWVEDALSAEEKAALSGHLASCDDCRRTVALTTTMDPAPEPRVAVDEFLLARVSSRARRPAWRPWVWTAAAAAAILVCVGIATQPDPRTTPAPAPPVARIQDPPRFPESPSVSRTVPTPGPVLPEIVKDPVILPAPSEAPPKPAPDPVAPPPPEMPKPPPDPAPVIAKPEPPPPGPSTTETDLGALFTSVYMVDPVGDLRVRRGGAPEAKAGGFERLGWKDTISAPTSAASFTLESRASVVLEKGAEATVSTFRPDAAYRLSVGQGLVMVDTEGAVQRWQVATGAVMLNFSDVSGRLALESRGGDLAALVLDGRAEVKVGAQVRKVSPGRELVLTRAGGLTEVKGDPAKKLARLIELKPRLLTQFAAAFDEIRDEVRPFPFTLLAGRLVQAPPGYFLQAETLPSLKPGDAPRLSAALRWDGSFPAVTGMVLRFRYRTSLPSFTVHVGKYSTEYAAKARPGQWGEAEILLRELSFEGTPLLPSDPVQEVKFNAPLDRRAGVLDVDGVNFLRRAGR